MRLKSLMCLLLCMGMIACGSTAIAEKWETDGWYTGKIVDEFGEEKHKSIITTVKGGFKNSATSGDLLYAQILIYKDTKVHVGVFLHCYSPRNGAEYFYDDYSYVMFKNTKGKTIKFRKPGKWSNVGISLYPSSKFVAFMKKSSGKVICVANDGGTGRYYFEISADGFNSIYDRVVLLK